jgi:hypothetical protein
MSLNLVRYQKKIVLNLKAVAKYKQSGYDIVEITDHSTMKNYKELMLPTREFLIKPSVTDKKQCKYPAAEDITAETKEQRVVQRNYLERCYLRELVDPRTGLQLTNEQKTIINTHIALGKVTLH